MKNEVFETSITTKEKETWIVFKDAVSKFLSNSKDPNYRAIVTNMLENSSVRLSMSVKIHFLLDSDFSSKNLETVNRE